MKGYIQYRHMVGTHQRAEIVQRCGASPQRVQGGERFLTIGVPLATRLRRESDIGSLSGSLSP